MSEHELLRECRKVIDHLGLLSQPPATHELREATIAKIDRHLAQPEAAPVAEEPAEILASRLIDAWCADKGKQIPWAKAVQIVAIVTKQADDERDRLLKTGDEDGSCGTCGRSDASPPSARALADEFIDIVFDGPTGNEGGRFIEKWLQRPDGYWVLRIAALESKHG